MVASETMKARSVIGKVLLVLALPLVLLGLIDPLEGGIALVAALVVYAVGFSLLHRRPPRYLWIPMVVSLVIGALTLGYAVSTLEFTTGPSRLDRAVVVGLWAYRLSVLATLVGGVIAALSAIRRKVA